VQREEGLARLQALGFSAADALALWQHFDDAERRGKPSHGHSRIPWLETQEFDAQARPRRIDENRWHGNGTVGYVVLARLCDELIANPPRNARLVVCEQTFPTGMLGYHVRRLADEGLVALLTATSPRRLGPPSGGPKLAGTNPLAIGIPSSDGAAIAVDASMGAVTWGDVVAGLAEEEQLVPFGGEHAHKAFALALGLQLLVDALVRDPGYAAVLVVAQPAADPVPALRAAAAGGRLPGDA